MSLSAGVHGAPDSSVISLVDSPERAVFTGDSEFLIDESSSTDVRPSALAAAQAFLSPHDKRSKMEDEAIAAANAGS